MLWLILSRKRLFSARQTQKRHSWLGLQRSERWLTRLHGCRVEGCNRGGCDRWSENVVSGPSIGASGGHCDNNLLPPRFNNFSDGVADGPWKIREKVRQNIKYGANLIKFCATGGVLSKGTNLKMQQYAEEEMRALVEEAESRGRRVAAHAHGTKGIKTAIKSGAASIEHASFIDDEGISLALERGTALVMDIYVSDYILEKGITLGFLPESINKERTVGRVQRANFQKPTKLLISFLDRMLESSLMD